MAAKRVDPLKAKEAKQKKIAIGGAVLLLALLAFQGPKTIKMLQGPQPVASTAAAPTTPVPPAPAPTTPGAGGTAAGEVPPASTVPAAELASVPDSDPAPEAEQGQLLTFERFASKDPFAQQAQPAPQPAATPAAEERPAESETAPPATGEETGSTGGFTSGGAATTPSPTVTQTVLASATAIAVNGLVEAVALEADFPAAEPTFTLVSVAKNGKSVELGIAGGSYADGDATMTLTFGKKLTLQNTADGSRYELELVAVEGFPVSKANQARLPAAPTAAPAAAPAAPAGG